MAGSSSRYPFKPDYAVPPGHTLADTLEELEMSQKELALRTGLTVQSINRIVAGTQPVTVETANKLELATGVPAKLWNNLEIRYREQLARVREREQLQADLDWLKAVPVRELIKRGELPDEKDKPTLLREVLKFYGVTTVGNYRAYWGSQAIAARKSQSFATDDGRLSAWVRLGERRAQQIDTGAYSKAAFLDVLKTVRGLTARDPQAFVPEMIAACAAVGVAVCLVPEFPKVPWHGASKWLRPGKAMILLGLRGKREDQFWFSFFHEACHILHDGKKEMYVNRGDRLDPCEIRANQFAADFQVPAAYAEQVASLRTKAQVRALAKQLGVATGIIVGQYRHATRDFKKFHDLNRALVWTG